MLQLVLSNGLVPAPAEFLFADRVAGEAAATAPAVSAVGLDATAELRAAAALDALGFPAIRVEADAAALSLTLMAARQPPGSTWRAGARSHAHDFDTSNGVQSSLGQLSPRSAHVYTRTAEAVPCTCKQAAACTHTRRPQPPSQPASCK